MLGLVHKNYCVPVQLCSS